MDLHGGPIPGQRPTLDENVDSAALTPNPLSYNPQGLSMDSWRICPFVGLSQLLFSMPRTDVRRALATHRYVERNVFSSCSTIDAYIELGIDLRYNEQDTLVEIYGYGSRSAPWSLNGTSIFDNDMDSLSLELATHGVAVSHRSEDGCCFESVGLSVSQQRDMGRIGSAVLFSEVEFALYLKVLAEVEHKQRVRAQLRNEPGYTPPANPFYRKDRELPDVGRNNMVS